MCCVPPFWGGRGCFDEGVLEGHFSGMLIYIRFFLGLAFISASFPVSGCRVQEYEQGNVQQR